MVIKGIGIIKWSDPNVSLIAVSGNYLNCYPRINHVPGKGKCRIN